MSCALLVATRWKLQNTSKPSAQTETPSEEIESEELSIAEDEAVGHLEGHGLSGDHSTGTGSAGTGSTGAHSTGPRPTRQEVTEILHAQKNKMQQCQARNLAATGQLDVQLEILPTGRVGSVQTHNSSIENLQLQNCALEVLRSAVFPTFKGPHLRLRHRVRFE